MRRLADELQDHIEALDTVMHDNVFMADGGETIAVKFADALGKTRLVRRIKKFRPVAGDQQAAIRQADHPVEHRRDRRRWRGSRG